MTSVRCLRFLASAASPAACRAPSFALRAAPVLSALLLEPIARQATSWACSAGRAPAAAAAAWPSLSASRSFASIALSQPPSSSSNSSGGSSGGSGGGNPGSSSSVNSVGSVTQLEEERLELLKKLSGISDDLLSCVVERQHEKEALVPRHTFKVDAQYVGARLNIYDLLARPELRGHYRRLHKGAVVLGLGDADIQETAEAEGMPLLEPSHLRPSLPGDSVPTRLAPSLQMPLTEPYMVAFSYGSVAFFNASGELRDRFLKVAREVATDPVSSDRPYTEEYSISVVPGLRGWSQLDPDNIKLRSLDLRNLLVISQVLAQSVAMDFYAGHVERALETFCNMNQEMQATQTFARVDKQVLLQLVAENNIVMTDIISKLGLHERYDIAWKHVECGRIWEFLRSELEVDQRFRTLDMKLNLIQDNLKYAGATALLWVMPRYFLEILQNRKSDTLEWTIIVLIAMEICLTLYELFISRWM